MINLKNLKTDYEVWKHGLCVKVIYIQQMRGISFVYL